ncbi:MAG: hypothetical protein ACPLPS_02490 [bacterium]
MANFLAADAGDGFLIEDRECEQLVYDGGEYVGSASYWVWLSDWWNRDGFEGLVQLGKGDADGREMKLEWLINLRQIKRQWIYLTLAVFVALPLFVRLNLPFFVGPQAKGLYEAVKNLPKDKVVLLAMDWGAATKGESMWQAQAVMEHLFKEKKPFIITGYDIQGPQLSQELAEKLAKEYEGKYGEEWVNVGFIAGGLPVLLRMAKDFKATFKQDSVERKPLSSFPLARRVKDIHDIGLIIDVTGSGSYGDWITIQTTYGVPLAVACTAVITPDLYPFLDSKQLIGMLSGLKGAAEYETLIQGMHQIPTLKMMMSQSMAHLLIIILIILGNIGLFLERRRKGIG